MTYHRLPIVFSTLFIMISTHQALAQQPVSQALINEYRSDVAYDFVQDRYLAVWEQGTATNTDVYARFLDAGGTPVGSAIAIASDPNRFEGAPRVACNALAYECFISYEVEVAVGDVDIWGYWISTVTGNVLAGPVSLASSILPEARPAISFSEGHDEYLAVWMYLAPGGEWNILGRWVSRNGSGFNYGNLLLVSTDHQSADPDVACAPDGDCLVVWSGDDLSYGMQTRNIFARRVGPTSTGAPYPVSDATNQEYLPVVTDIGEITAGEPRFAIAWVIANPSSPGAFAMGRTVSDSAPLTPSYVITGAVDEESRLDIDGSRYLPYSGQTQFIAVWSNPANDIVAREFYFDGSARHSEMTLSSASNHESSPSLRCDRTDDCVVTYDFMYSALDLDVHSATVSSMP